MRVSADLCKLIMSLPQQKDSVKVENPTEFCFEFFTLYVVNDIGQEDALKFLKEVLLPTLPTQDQDALKCRVVEQYLSKPIKHISQKSLLDSLVYLGISEFVLIKFMVKKLDEADKTWSPANMMFSVLSLVLQSYESIRADAVVKD